MNDIIKRVWWQDKTVTPDDLNGYIFTSESQAHTFVIEGKNKNSGMPVLINGTVTGEFVNADGVTVPLTGSANGVATLTLTPECYFVPGRFKLTIYVRNGSQNVCIYLGNGHCDKSASDTVAYPSTALPDLAQLMAQFKSQMDNIYSAFPTETVGPADVVTFDDGADDIPVKSLTVQMEPQQDLHGYDKPWVGGAGKNLISLSGMDMDKTVSGVTLSTNGSELTIRGTATAEVQTNATLASQYARMPMGPFPAGTYTIKATGFEWQNASDRLLINARYSDNSNVENAYSKRIGGNSSGTVTFTAIQEFKFGLFIALQSGSTFDCTVRVQFEAGSTATDYEPYSNICPITGWDEITVARTGKNLWDTQSVTSNYAINASGVITQLNGWCYTEIVKVLPGTTYTYSFTSLASDGWMRRLHGYDKNGTWVQQLGYVNQANVGTRALITFTVPDDVVGIRASLYSTEYKSSQLEFGSTATAYEAYQGQTVSVNISSVAGGTVYGGTLDITTGELVVDRKRVDLGGLSFAYNSTSGLFYATVSDAIAVNQHGDEKAVCSCYVNADYLTGGTLQNGEFCLCDGQFSATKRLAIKDDRYSDVATFKAAVTGQDLVYTLESPITYAISQAEITSLLGGNTIWTDAGQVTVTYRADTEMYINKRLAEQ